MIVVVIIGIIAAIAVPNLLASRRSANEGATVSALRTLHSAQMTYASTYGNGNFAGDVGAGTPTALSALATLGLIDGALGSANKSGYNLVGGRVASAGAQPGQFFFSAIPTSGTGVTATGSRRFGVETGGVLMADGNTTAHFADPAAVQVSTPFTN